MAAFTTYAIIRLIQVWSEEEEKWIADLKQEAAQTGQDSNQADSKSRMPKQTKLHKNGTEKRRTRPKRKVWKRKINFRRKNFGNLEEWDPDPQMKKVLLWTGYGPLQEGDQLWGRVFKALVQPPSSCPESRCTFSTTRSLENQEAADAIVFHMPNFHWDGYKTPTMRKAHQNWVFMSYETATNVRERARHSSRQQGEKFLLGSTYPPIDWARLRGIFNRTFTFRSDSDAVAKHGEIAHLKTTEAEGRTAPVWTDRFDRYTAQNWNISNNREKAPVIWFVSHCRSHSGRDRYVRRLAKRIGVHIYGGCGTKTCGQDRRLRNPYTVERDPCFDLVAREYKFYLSFENDICTDYITEKAFNALQLDTVPVLLSGASLSTLLPPGSVIDALSRSPEQLADHLYSLLADEQAYQAHFTWRKHFSVQSHQSVPSPCDLCQALHSTEWSKPKTYPDMATWFNSGSGCRSWDGVNPRSSKRTKREKSKKTL